MSVVEAPFIVAVIREKEKHFLSDQDITRIMHATSLADAREVLMSTPYAMFLVDDTSVTDGLTHALEAEFLWLQQSLDNPNILAFISARYDTLHCAQAIIALAIHSSHVPSMSNIGTLSRDMLQEMVFTQDYEETKETLFWSGHIQKQKDAMDKNQWSFSFLYASMQRVLEDCLTELAVTPFMDTLATFIKNRHEADMAFRSDTMQMDATHYEWEWDVRAIDLARALRFEPVGYDPIIAYWVTKEMEIKTIRLVLAALAGGFSREEVTSLIRPFAHV